MKVEIVNDGDPENPRSDDNFGSIVAFHKRYNLGDDTDLKSSMFEGWDDLEDHLQREEGAVVILPLYLHDHSGITMNTTGFGCKWDSGQVGFIYATREQIFKEYTSHRRLTKKLREKVEEQLRAEVTVYDQYLTGDIWGYRVLDDDDEEVDSCWGIYGYDYAKQEGEQALRLWLLPALYKEHMEEKCVCKGL